MSRGEYPASRLGVVQRVLVLDRLADVAERSVVVMAPVFDLAVEHGRGNLEHVHDAVREVEPARRHALRGFPEELALGVCVLQVARRGVCDVLSAVRHDGLTQSSVSSRGLLASSGRPT